MEPREWLADVLKQWHSTDPQLLRWIKGNQRCVTWRSHRTTQRSPRRKRSEVSPSYLPRWLIPSSVRQKPPRRANAVPACRVNPNVRTAARDWTVLLIAIVCLIDETMLCEEQKHAATPSRCRSAVVYVHVVALTS